MPSVAQKTQGTTNAPTIVVPAQQKKDQTALQPCSPAKRKEVLEPAGPTQRKVSLTCSLTLDPKDVVTKGIVFEGSAASNAQLDCNGATIDGRGPNAAPHQIYVVSKKISDTEWSAPHDVSIRNCKVFGNIRVAGMSDNGEGDDIRKSSLSLGHTARAQAAAPSGIVFDNIDFTSVGGSGIYFAPGTTHSVFKNSTIKGSMASVSIYLDAESADNVIQNNLFNAESKVREVIAVDGSSRNTIVGNFFSGLSHGGIFLYRNCGEGGTVRHQSPHWNKIINNVFYYNKMSDDTTWVDELKVDVWNLFASVDKVAGPNPSIWIASRNGNRDYCDLDKGYDFGSSANNNDLVKNTVILDNRIFKLNPKVMIRISDSPVIVQNNESINPDKDLGSPGRPSGRKSSCFAATAFPNPYLAHGESASRFVIAGETEYVPVCKGVRVTCNDGALESAKITCPSEPKPEKIISFECHVSGDNGGCKKEIACPDSKKIKSIRAACNLEFGLLDQNDLKSTPWNTLKVDVPSDHVSDGMCRIDSIQTHLNSERLDDLRSKTRFEIGCKENDKNGGDCHIMGQAVCE